MVYTLGKAAKAVGKSKATISKAIKSGRLSAIKGDNGIYAIDPSELHRVYPILNTETDTNQQRETLKLTPEPARMRELEILLDAANQRITDKDAQIDDIRNDRDKWRQQAQGLLTDHRPQGFWSRLFSQQ